MPKNEFEVVKHFSTILNLPNQTDGTLFIYLKPNSLEKTALKPDGYYHYEGVTFILDAKGEGKKFNNQLEDYMRLESNPNYIGFKYSGDKFFCYIKGKINEYETQPQRAEYYIKKFFNIKTTNEDIVNNSAKKLAQLFREAGIDKQMNVPFIGALMLCLKFKKEILNNTTRGILNFAREGITDIISETPLSRKQKKEFLKRILDDSTLQKCKIENLLLIISEISKIYNFINVSEKKGHDTMNNFLKIFRKWNSANSKEKGEVFTPDHIAQLMYKLIDCNKSDTILDPTCGSGTFLTNAMANMLSETEDADEQKDIKENRLIGIELNEFNCTLAGINMMLHGDGASQIFYEDCFKKLPLLKDCYNKVLMNPPFSQPSIPELKFVSIALNNMRGGGLLASILPISCVLSKKQNYSWKDEILKNHQILKTIKLPKQLFFPNASVETCICIFQAYTKTNKYIEKYDFSDDGYEVQMRNGRVNVNNELKTNEFWENFYSNNSVEICESTASNDWLMEEKFDYNSIKKIDFLKAKIDFNIINKNIMEELYSNGGNLNLNINISDIELNINEWKEFKISDLFEIVSKGKDKISKEEIFSDFPCVNAKNNNNGIGGFIDQPKKIFKGNQIAVVCQGDGGAGLTYYQEYDFCATSCVTILKAKFRLNTNIGIFIAKVCSLKWKPIYSHGKSLTNEELLNQTIKLPSKSNDELDIDFINEYMVG